MAKNKSKNITYIANEKSIRNFNNELNRVHSKGSSKGITGKGSKFEKGNRQLTVYYDPYLPLQKNKTVVNKIKKSKKGNFYVEVPLHHMKDTYPEIDKFVNKGLGVNSKKRSIDFSDNKAVSQELRRQVKEEKLNPKMKGLKLFWAERLESKGR